MGAAESGSEQRFGGVFRALPGGVEDLVRRLVAGVPPLVEASRNDLELHFRRVLHEQLTRLDLCSRTEFDAQGRVLERVQQRVAELERRVVALEQQAGSGPGAGTGGGDTRR